MINIYTKYECIPKTKNFVKYNDAFFDAYINADCLDTQDKALLFDLEQVTVLDAKTDLCQGNYGLMQLKDISTGLKTLINLRYIKKQQITDVCLNITECGKNYLEYVFDELNDSGISGVLQHCDILGLRDRCFWINDTQKVRTIKALHHCIFSG